MWRIHNRQRAFTTLLRSAYERFDFFTFTNHQQMSEYSFKMCTGKKGVDKKNDIPSTRTRNPSRLPRQSPLTLRHRSSVRVPRVQHSDSMIIEYAASIETFIYQHIATYSMLEDKPTGERL